MKKRITEMVHYSVILTCGVLISFIAGCGGGGGNPAPATTSAVSTGTISTSSSGMTPATDTTVKSPAGSTLTLKSNTTLTDINGLPITGNISTSVTYSTSANDLQAAAVNSTTPDVATFLDISLGSVKHINPPMTAKMVLPNITEGTLVNIYSFDGTTWALENTDMPVAADGTVSMSIGHLSIWAAARKKATTGGTGGTGL